MTMNESLPRLRKCVLLPYSSNHPLHQKVDEIEIWEYSWRERWRTV